MERSSWQARNHPSFPSWTDTSVHPVPPQVAEAFEENGREAEETSWGEIHTTRTPHNILV